MKKADSKAIALSFFSWQCRVRQIAMRQHNGRPTPGMQPKVLVNNHPVLAAMNILLVPKKHEEETSFFQFQVQKTPDPRQVFEAVLKHLQGDYFHKPKKFLPQMTAQFAPDSEVAAGLAKAGECLLEFDEYNQIWRMMCKVKKLKDDDPLRQYTLRHNRCFNPNNGDDVSVLAFKPKWRSANASPPPPELA